MDLIWDEVRVTRDCNKFVGGFVEKFLFLNIFIQSFQINCLIGIIFELYLIYANILKDSHLLNTKIRAFISSQRFRFINYKKKLIHKHYSGLSVAVNKKEVINNSDCVQV